MSWYEQREEARVDFIAEHQEYTENDIIERDEEIKQLKEKNQKLKQIIDAFKKIFPTKYQWIKKGLKKGTLETKIEELQERLKNTKIEETFNLKIKEIQKENLSLKCQIKTLEDEIELLRNGM